MVTFFRHDMCTSYDVYNHAALKIDLIFANSTTPYIQYLHLRLNHRVSEYLAAIRIRISEIENLVCSECRIQYRFCCMGVCMPGV